MVMIEIRERERKAVHREQDTDSRITGKEKEMIILVSCTAF
jgi:hypothetical protein